MGLIGLAGRREIVRMVRSLIDSIVAFDGPAQSSAAARNDGLGVIARDMIDLAKNSQKVERRR